MIWDLGIVSRHVPARWARLSCLPSRMSSTFRLALEPAGHKNLPALANFRASPDPPEYPHHNTSDLGNRENSRFERPHRVGYYHFWCSFIWSTKL